MATWPKIWTPFMPSSASGSTPASTMLPSATTSTSREHRFLDTVGMLALWDEADQWHQGAQAALEKLTTARHSLITTTFVLLECGNAAARQPYRTTVVEWRDVMSANQGLIAPASADWNEAWKAYERGDAAAAGIVDQVSF